MKKQFFGMASLLMLLWLLTACGREPVSYQEEQPHLFAALLPERYDGIAAGLCVVYGSEPTPGDDVIGRAACVFSDDGSRTIIQRDPYGKFYPASITKIMTALLAIKYGDLSESITVGDEVVITESGASLCKIKPGDTLTLEQLLYGLMLPSGNDAAEAIAVAIAGSEEAFASLMNEEAQRLGATGTHFVNPHGLTNRNHYTTAYDLYLIMHEALKEPVFRQVIGTLTYTAEYYDSEGELQTQTWSNSNQYLTGQRQLPEGLSLIGGKTGTTNAAGHCLILATEDQYGNDYISVVLDSATREDLYHDMTELISQIVN